MDVCRFLTGDVFAFGAERLRRLDQFDIESCTEGFQMRYGEVVRTRISRAREILIELSESEGCQDGHDIRIVTKVKIY